MTDATKSMPTLILSKLDSWWKAAILLGAIVSTSVFVGMTLNDAFKLPNQVRENRDRIVALEQARGTIESEAVRSRQAIESRLARLECLVVAGRRNTPIEECL